MPIMGGGRKMDKNLITRRRKMRIVLNPEYIERVKKESSQLQARADALEPKTIPCRFCGYPAAVKYGGTVGLVQVKCRHCNQEAIYDTADYRHYSYIAYPEKINIEFQEHA